MVISKEPYLHFLQIRHWSRVTAVAIYLCNAPKEGLHQTMHSNGMLGSLCNMAHECITFEVVFYKSMQWPQIFLMAGWWVEFCDLCKSCHEFMETCDTAVRKRKI